MEKKGLTGIIYIQLSPIKIQLKKVPYMLQRLHSWSGSLVSKPSLKSNFTDMI